MIDPELRALLEEMSINIAAIRLRMDKIQMSDDDCVIARIMEPAPRELGMWRPADFRDALNPIDVEPPAG